MLWILLPGTVFSRQRALFDRKGGPDSLSQSRTGSTLWAFGDHSFLCVISEAMRAAFRREIFDHCLMIYGNRLSRRLG
jgi:hypothetical protein